jgi:para-nitrobenzyl esterase
MLAVAGERSSQLKPVLDQMHAALVRFVSSGAPSGTDWPNYEAERRDTFVFDDDSTLVSDPDRELRLVWSTLLL